MASAIRHCDSVPAGAPAGATSPIAPRICAIKFAILRIRALFAQEIEFVKDEDDALDIDCPLGNHHPQGTEEIAVVVFVSLWTDAQVCFLGVEHADDHRPQIALALRPQSARLLANKLRDELLGATRRESRGLSEQDGRWSAPGIRQSRWSSPRRRRGGRRRELRRSDGDRCLRYRPSPREHASGASMTSSRPREVRREGQADERCESRGASEVRPVASWLPPIPWRLSRPSCGPRPVPTAACWSCCFSCST